MEQKYAIWLELYASWNVDDRIGVKCSGEETADSLTKRFWDTEDKLFHCPRAYVGDETYIMPAKSQEFIGGNGYTFSKVGKGSGRSL